MENSNVISKEYVRDFILAGNALFTLQNGTDYNHFTYTIKRCKTKEHLYFINRLSSADNNDNNSYQYIGCFYDDTDYFHPCKEYVNKNRMAWPASLRTIELLLSKLDDIPEHLTVLHHCKCARCGRLLTTPESIRRGLGPECAKNC